MTPTIRHFCLSLLASAAATLGNPLRVEADLFYGEITQGVSSRTILEMGPSVDYDLVGPAYATHNHAGLTAIKTLALDSFTSAADASPFYTSAWFDTVTLGVDPGVTRPDQILLRYAVDGGLHLDLSTMPAFADSHVGVSSYTGAARYASLDLLYDPTNGIRIDRYDDTGDLNHLTVAEISPTDYGVNGYVTELVNLTSDGIGFTQVYLTTSATFGTADFQGTLTLSAVTLADGSPLPDGVRYSFASGLVPTAVPEPSSLISAGIGCFLAAVGYAWRPRGRVAGARCSCPGLPAKRADA